MEILQGDHSTLLVAGYETSRVNPSNNTRATRLGTRSTIEGEMYINIQVRQKDLEEQIAYLKSQMAYYGEREEAGGMLCMMGDKFNLYIYPYNKALMPDTYRSVDIYPKDTPV